MKKATFPNTISDARIREIVVNNKNLREMINVERDGGKSITEVKVKYQTIIKKYKVKGSDKTPFGIK